MLRMKRIRGVSANLLTEQDLAEGKGVVLQLGDCEGTEIRCTYAKDHVTKLSHMVLKKKFPYKKNLKNAS